MKTIAEKKYKYTNWRERANGPSVLANQNARLAKAIL